jgi:hypothetical protein
VSELDGTEVTERREERSEREGSEREGAKFTTEQRS